MWRGGGGVARGGGRGSAREGGVARERRYHARECTVREREPIVEALPREDILRIAEPMAVPQKRGVL